MRRHREWLECLLGLSVLLLWVVSVIYCFVALIIGSSPQMLHGFPECLCDGCIKSY